jgi:hypothetical protein
MDSKKFKSILRDALEEQIPASQINLLPTIQSQLVAGKKSYLQQGENINKPRSKRLVLSTLALIILLTLALITPQGRAFAQNILQFFVRANGDTLPVPTEPVDWAELTAGVPQLHAASTPRPAVAIFASDCGEFPTPTCSVEEIREKVDFTVKELSNIPDNMYFMGATGGPDSILLKYEFENNSGGLTIFEERWTGKPEKGTSEVGASALVEKVQIGNLAGEYFRGSFSMRAGDPETVWDPDFPVETLRWVEGGVSYTLGYDFTTQMPLGKERLIALAKGMTTEPVANVPLPAATTPESNEFSLRNVFNLSIPQAEELAGVKLLVPSQLPEFLSFLGAKYEVETKVSRVFYVVEEPYMNGLTVSQQVVSEPDDCAICDIVVGNSTQLGSDNSPMIVGADSNLETVEIGDVTGQYVTGVWKGTDCCGWVWDSEPFLKTLRWQIDDRAFELQYTGSDLSKTDLVAIAEDLK